MKKIYFLSLLAATVMSCGGVDTPPNNAMDKGHEEASKVEVHFIPGNLRNDNIDGGIYGNGFVKDADAAAGSSTVIKEEQENHSFHTEGKVTLKKGKWYQVQIDFYNKSGNKINSQFTANEEQRDMHQFFFRYMLNGKNIYESAEKVPYEYRYGDIYDDGSLIKPAVGFTGYIRLKDSAPEHFNIDMMLVHVVPPGRKTDAKGNPYPFYNPPLRLMGITDTRIDLDITALN